MPCNNCSKNSVDCVRSRPVNLLGSSSKRQKSSSHKRLKLSTTSSSHPIASTQKRATASTSRPSASMASKKVSKASKNSISAPVRQAPSVPRPSTTSHQKKELLPKPIPQPNKDADVAHQIPTTTPTPLETQVTTAFQKAMDNNVQPKMDLLMDIIHWLVQQELATSQGVAPTAFKETL